MTPSLKGSGWRGHLRQLGVVSRSRRLVSILSSSILLIASLLFLLSSHDSSYRLNAFAFLSIVDLARCAQTSKCLKWSNPPFLYVYFLWIIYGSSPFLHPHVLGVHTTAVYGNFLTSLAIITDWSVLVLSLLV